jgi:hypothetical protein
LATYVFFIFTVIGRQKLDGIGIGEKPERMQSGRLPMSIDLFIPVYTVLQFFFYMGLLKVRKGKEDLLIVEINFQNQTVETTVMCYFISTFVLYIPVLNVVLLYQNPFSM